MPSARKFIAKPETIWSARSVTEKSACISASSAAGDHPDQQAEHPRAGHLGAPDAPERAHQHHALEPDVDDAAALGEQPAERGEQQRRRVAEHRGQQRRPDDDALEVRLRPTCVAAMPPTMPMTAAATAPQPSRFSPLRVAHAPAAMAARPSTTVGIGERIVSGGSATKNARNAEHDAGPADARGGHQPPRSACSAGGRGRGSTGSYRRLRRSAAPPPRSCRAAATGTRRGCRRSRTGSPGPG